MKFVICLLCLLQVSITASVFGETLVWTDKDAVAVWKSNPDGSNPVQLYGSMDGLQDPRGIAVDPVTNTLFLADQDTNTIYQGDLVGSPLTPLISGLNAPADLVLKGGTLYWAEQNGNRIRSAAADGSGVTDIVTGLNEPYYLDVDPLDQRVYWSDFDSGTIHTAAVADGQAADLISGLVRVRDVELDLDNGKVYWADRDRPDIRRQNLDGTGVETLFAAADGLGRPHGLWLDPVGGMIYWTDTTTGDVVRGNMDGFGAPEIISNGPSSNGPWAIQLVVPEPIMGTWLLVAFTAIAMTRRRMIGP